MTDAIEEYIKTIAIASVWIAIISAAGFGGIFWRLSEILKELQERDSTKEQP